MGNFTNTCKELFLDDITRIYPLRAGILIHAQPETLRTTNVDVTQLSCTVSGTPRMTATKLLAAFCTQELPNTRKTPMTTPMNPPMVAAGTMSFKLISSPRSKKGMTRPAIKLTSIKSSMPIP